MTDKIYDQREDLHQANIQNQTFVCECVNVDFGSYDNQVELLVPPHMKAYRQLQGGHPNIICVDKCLAKEIQSLWDRGIITTGCCCGHNKAEGFIGVIFDHIPYMTEMGYKVHFNKSRPGDFDSFVPKSLDYTKHPSYPFFGSQEKGGDYDKK